MRPLTRTKPTPPTSILVGLVMLAMTGLSSAGEDRYRLLEVNGHKLKWGDQRLGTGATISYAFANASLRVDDALAWFADAPNCRTMASVTTLFGDRLTRQILAEETAAAFRVWERAAGLSFHEVEDPRNADIIIGAQSQPRGWAYANVSPSPVSDADVRPIQQALVCLNPTHAWKVGFDGNEAAYDIRYTLIHEIGHAIGLDHPGPSGAVMAFRYTEAFNGLQPGDVRGVRLLYGPPASERTSNAGLVGSGDGV